jgi:hypothetical protein
MDLIDHDYVEEQTKVLKILLGISTFVKYNYSFFVV